MKWKTVLRRSHATEDEQQTIERLVEGEMVTRSEYARVVADFAEWVDGLYAKLEGARHLLRGDDGR